MVASIRGVGNHAGRTSAAYIRCPRIGWAIVMFHIRPIDETGIRMRKKMWNETGRGQLVSNGEAQLA